MMAIKGLIEGFYGRPWSWDERLDVMRFCHARGMTHYVYAPKDDPRHRTAWRDPYPRDELDGFARLVDDRALTVGFGLSPGLSIDYASDDDRRALAAKLDQVLSLGVPFVCLALDDIPPRPHLAEDQAELCRWLFTWLDGRADLVLVPTDYVNIEPNAYLSALADGVPAEVPIAWTGVSVVNDTITADQARARAEALGGRPPLLWDNYPVNDAVMADRLFLGPLRGRDPRLVEECCGYLANPMVQPRASRLPLASTAAFLEGEDPIEAWQREADATGLRAFAEACDGGLPRELLTDGDAKDEGQGRLRAWLEEAADCAAPGLEGEADRWLDQVHREARTGLAALRYLDDRRLEDLLAVLGAWPALRRSRVSVMGVRCGFRPVLGQGPEGSWVVHQGALQDDQNVIDALVRRAVAAAGLVGTGP